MSGDTESVRAIDGSFALVTIDGLTVRMARSLDRPMRYFLAKRHEGPALFVADRIDTLAPRARRTPVSTGSSIRAYTRMVPAHYWSSSRSSAVPIPIRSTPASSLLGEPACRRISTRSDERYVGALAGEIAKWLRSIDHADNREPIGVSFSGGIDSGSVFLLTYHTMLQLGMAPTRLKAFVLDLGNGPDGEQARAFLDAVGLSMFLEEIDGRVDDLERRGDAARPRGLQGPRRRMRCDGPAALPGHSRTVSRVAAPGRRRRRRRKPEGLSDRGESRAHHPQRRRQPDALSGRLGRRTDQALADLQRRSQPQLRAYLCAGDAVRLRRFQPLYPAGCHRRRRSRFRSPS